MLGRGDEIVGVVPVVLPVLRRLVDAMHDCLDSQWNLWRQGYQGNVFCIPA